MLQRYNVFELNACIKLAHTCNVHCTLSYMYIVRQGYFSILGAKVEYMLNCNWPTQSNYITITKEKRRKERK